MRVCDEMTVEELMKIKANDSLPNSQIEKIYCHSCGLYEEWHSYCGHYYCKKCNQMVGFWVGSGNGMPLTWAKDGSRVYLVPCILREIKE